MDKTAQFVHLHLHTSYSLLDGACRINELMKAIEENRMPAVAITDHGVMYGIVDFYNAARAKGIKPILGCELYVAPGSRFERKESGSRVTSNHLVLLAADDTGYFNLIKLVTAGHLDGFYYKPRIDKEILQQYHKGLIGLSGCLKGEVAQCLLADDPDSASRVAGEYAEILGRDNFFLEIQDHNLSEQKKINPALIQLSSRAQLPLVATNDVHYLKKSYASAHEILLCMQTGKVFSEPKRMRFGSEEFYLKSAKEMQTLFSELPEALHNTIEIAHRCNVQLKFGESHLPSFTPPKGYTQKSYLIKLCKEGVQKRYGIKDIELPHDDRERNIINRLKHELDIIEKTGFISYFLIVSDFIRFAHEHEIPVGPGRGSGTSSVVSYSLGITGVDPLHYKLVFERFLNPERINPPDFDIDFCQFRRGEVINYVKEKYGSANIAQIITFGTLGAKTAIRDVGRVLEVPIRECDRLAKLVPDDPKITLELAMHDSLDLRRASREEPNAKRILKFAQVLEGLQRHVSTHAAGVVFGDKPLVDILPLARDKAGEAVTQYHKDNIDAIGLLKADFLGLKTLTVISETIKLIQRTKGIALNIQAIPINDPETFELLKVGNTIGVFQLESRGMRDLVRRIGLDKIEDLIATIALFRPGPMNMLDDYVNRKMGRTKIKYDDPRLEPILSETYGVMLYQEQVQQAAHILAGYSLGQGDILRQAMGKKKPDEMEKQRKSFMEGCKKTSGLTARKSEKIFDNIAKFAGYGFNKSHSTGYAIIAYQTAFLKAHYPAEFMSALLTSEIGNTDKLPLLMAEAENMGLKILPPDINASFATFMPEEKAIRFGLAGIKNVGTAAAKTMVEERIKNGSFQGLINFCSRLDPRIVNRKTLESLIRCGAFDFSGYHRAQLFNNIGLALSRAESIQRDRLTGQRTLFALLEESTKDGKPEELPEYPQWHESELLKAEKELLGIYMSGHPLSQYEPILKHYRLSTVPGLSDIAAGKMTRIAGLITKIEKKITKNKDLMAVIKIEDTEGVLEALVFPQAYAQYKNLLHEHTIVIACGQVTKNEDTTKFIVSELYSLEQTLKLFTDHISLHLATAILNDELLAKIQTLLKAYPGNTPIVLCLQFPTGEEIFLKAGPSWQVTATEKLAHELNHLLGEDSIYIAVNNQVLRKTNNYFNNRQPATRRM